MRALVTGGAGFIGQHLARALSARGDEVTVLDDLARGSGERLDQIQRLTFVRGDVRDRAALDRALDGADVVFHLAALVSAAQSVDDPVGTDDINVRGTIEVVLGAVRSGVRRVVLASSCAVYGERREPARETDPARPSTPYAASKLAAEHFAHALGSAHGVETVALRYFNVFGPGQDERGDYAAVVPRFIAAALDGRPATIDGDGTQTRDFVFIDDAVTATMRAATATGAAGLSINVGSGESRSVLELHAAIAAIVGAPITPIIGPPRAVDVAFSMAALDLARDRLGHVSTTRFDDALRRTIDAYRRRG